MSFSILSKRTRRTIGIAAALVVTNILIYGFLSSHQQTKNDTVPKVNLVQAAIYSADKTATVPLLYAAVEGETCIRQLTFAVSSATEVSPSAAAPTATSLASSAQSSSEIVAEEPPLVNASSPRCLAQTPAPDGYQKLAEEGSVTLALNLAASGRVERGEIEKSSGFIELDEAALKQVRETWQFEPCKKAEQAVACRQYIRFRWQVK